VWDVRASKQTTLERAVALVADGDVLGIHGNGVVGSPMAFLRELVRARRRDLHVVTLGGSIGVDWLAAAGAISRCTFCVISLERFGLCQSFRRGVEAGRIQAEELSETAFYARLEAAARSLPYLPTQGMIGTDLLEVGNPNLAVVTDPFGGRPVVACKALPLDVAVVHAARADEFGNVGVEPHARFPTLTLMPQAASTVIVTVEEIVSSDELRRQPDRTVIPGFSVTAVVEVPFGAHPTSLFPRYNYDTSVHETWSGARASTEVDALMDEYVYRYDTHEKYLDAIGRDRLAALAGAFRW
jgi:glutaconate CoA-transferase, subunit A